MSESKHTPGPWHVAGNGLSRYVEGRVRPGVMQEVAWCGATEVSGQMESNARLISAAPELLESAERAERWLVLLEGHKISNECASVIEKLRAAIAKATGA